MKKAAGLFAASILVASLASAAEVRGAWTAELDDNDASKVQMNLSTRNHHSTFGRTMALADFSGLPASTMNSAVQTPASFALRREAGNVSFEGTFKNGFGAGQFSFSPNPDYIATLRNVGVSFEDSDHGDSEYLSMALLDVSTSFIKAMQAEGYRESAEKYLSMRIFDINPDYVGAMRAAGYRDLTSDNLIAFRIHGVTPEFINDLRTMGYTNVASDDLVAMRIHGVTPKFIRELREAGYEHVPVEKLIEMRIHGIDANFVKRMNHNG